MGNQNYLMKTTLTIIDDNNSRNKGIVEHVSSKRIMELEHFINKRVSVVPRGSSEVLFNLGNFLHRNIHLIMEIKIHRERLLW